MSDQRFTRLTGDVANVTDMIRLRRFGKIRLGIKKKHAQSGKEYPSATDADGKPIDYFVCPPEVEAAYGKNPKVIHGAMFASNNPEEVYIEKLARYGKGTGLKCHGNGTVAKERQEDGTWKERKCPCDHLKSKENPSGTCTPKADLMVMLPQIPHGLWGNYQITTHSTYARAGILSSLADLQRKAGRIAFVPIMLERIPTPIVHEGHEKIHYIVGFTPELSIPQLMDLRRNPDALLIESKPMEPPVDENPEDDPVDVETDQLEPDEQGQIDAAQLAEHSEAEMEAVREKLKAPAQSTPQQAPPSGSVTTVTPKAEPKPKPPANPTSREALKPIDPSLWVDTINAIEEDPDLRDVKEQVKKGMGLPSLHHAKVTAPGQHEFLKRFKAKAIELGFEARLKPIFG